MYIHEYILSGQLTKDLDTRFKQLERQILELGHTSNTNPEYNTHVHISDAQTVYTSAPPAAPGCVGTWRRATTPPPPCAASAQFAGASIGAGAQGGAGGRGGAAKGCPHPPPTGSTSATAYHTKIKMESLNFERGRGGRGAGEEEIRKSGLVPPARALTMSAVAIPQSEGRGAGCKALGGGGNGLHLTPLETWKHEIVCFLDRSLCCPRSLALSLSCFPALWLSRSLALSLSRSLLLSSCPYARFVTHTHTLAYTLSGIHSFKKSLGKVEILGKNGHS